MDFRILGLDPAPFLPLFQMNAEALAAADITEHLADEPAAYPCRISLEDAAPGERLLLVNFEHLPLDTPYRSRGPIFVRAGASWRYDRCNEIPDQLTRRLLSVRAYDQTGTMRDADVVPGNDLPRLIDQLLRPSEVAFLHVHFARRGCYACRIERI